MRENEEMLRRASKHMITFPVRLILKKGRLTIRFKIAIILHISFIENFIKNCRNRLAATPKVKKPEAVFEASSSAFIIAKGFKGIKNITGWNYLSRNGIFEGELFLHQRDSFLVDVKIVLLEDHLQLILILTIIEISRNTYSLLGNGLRIWKLYLNFDTVNWIAEYWVACHILDLLIYLAGVAIQHWELKGLVIH